MLRVTLITCGSLKERYLKDAVAEYEKRLKAYVNLQCREVADGPGIKEEGERIRKAIPEGAYVVILDLKGEEITSEGFADTIEDLMNNGVSHICFIIGGSEGIDADVKSLADLSLSFSRMTFPHQLFRVIFLEQLYRAFRIIKKEPYHK